MSKEDIRKVLGVTAAVFAHRGQISEAEAQEMSGLDTATFKEVLGKVGKAAEEVKAEPNKKHDGFYDIVSHAADEYLAGIRK